MKGGDILDFEKGEGGSLRILGILPTTLSDMNREQCFSYLYIAIMIEISNSIRYPDAII